MLSRPLPRRPGALRRRDEADDAGLLPHRRARRIRAARQPARSAGMDGAAVRCRDRRRTQGIGRRVGVREGAAASAMCLCACEQCLFCRRSGSGVCTP
eukprot:COSAG02_NODE_3221_length_7152_cov_4.360981_2_plen_98_part_00